ncbi:rRNA maturation RNase YbeY [bacterium]|nr:rRNA maturation RNase YbeY [bacterium]
MSTLDLTLQCATDANAPPREDFAGWAQAALADVECACAELTVRLVAEDESAQLNGAYRQKPTPTNVLSFGYGDSLPDETLVGDLVICPAVVEREARQQGKPLADHWAHLTVHGVLHLCGFDHESDIDAAQMEAREAAILARLGIADPYLTDAA